MSLPSLISEHGRHEFSRFVLPISDQDCLRLSLFSDAEIVL
jgi:hypothetical protein